jgi:hypothetical protein
MRSRWFLTFAAVALLSAGALVTSTSPAGATTVTDEATFRAAWTNAAETQITLAADITLTNCGAGVPTRSSATALTLTGNGHTIRQTCASQGVLSRSGTGLTTLDGVTITGGDSAGFGGGILSSGGPLTLNGSTITANHAATSGGGIAEVGTLTLTNSTVSNNTAGAAGGGTLVNGPAVVTNSTISGNTSTTGGGGIHANPGPLTITNSTITGNTDLGGGGGVVADNGTITLVYTTIAQNTSGTGANVMASTSLVSFGSVVALPTGGGTNCGFLGAPSTTSNGNNFSDDASCGFTAATDRQNAGDPGLSALANNGGPTQTRLPQPGSPLIDAIPVASCQADGASGITTDQRSLARPSGSGCDIGAVEVQVAAPAPAPAPVVITPKFTG